MKPRLSGLSSDTLSQCIERALSVMEECRICPRHCKVNRMEDELGFCKIGRNAKIASYNLHFGEESVLVGNGGSGTIFFSGCNLGCIFCQNWDISHHAVGPEAGSEELAGVMLELQNQGAENINFVTPSHVVPQILEALPLALEHGLHLPLVYNSSGYDSLETLRLLDGIMDIYMPDAKFFDPESAGKYCLAKDYPLRAREAITEMHRQVGDLEVDSRGVAEKGLLVRHLLMPGGLAGTRQWLEFLAGEISKDTYLNIMNQYRACGDADKHPELLSSVSGREHEEALRMAAELGLTRLDQGGYKLADNLLRRLLGK